MIGNDASQNSFHIQILLFLHIFLDLSYLSFSFFCETVNLIRLRNGQKINVQKL